MEAAKIALFRKDMYKTEMEYTKYGAVPSAKYLRDREAAGAKVFA